MTIDGMTEGHPAAPLTPDLGALASQVVDRTLQIAQVPAPSGGEQQRAAIVAGWWRDDGFELVASDEVGNCWARLRPGRGPALVLAAHLDTVFSREADHTASRAGDRLIGPSVGDNSVALAALGAVGRLLGSSDGALPVWALATVGEEGFGNLAGARHALAHPPVELGALIAVEGNYLGRLGTVGIGSQRWRVVVEGPGGHAWEQSGAPSAVHEVARIVHALTSIPTVPGTSSLNVGQLAGGEAINARARRASFDLELRGTDEATLAHLDAKARALLSTPLAPEMTIEVSDTGRRPAGRVDAGHPLVHAARAALAARAFTWREVASSTDANAAHPLGVPALALGVTTGSGEHTPKEWIDIVPIADGLAILADTVVRYDQSLRSGAAPADQGEDG